MTKGRKPGRPKQVSGSMCGARLLSYGQRKMIRILAESRAQGRRMYQYQAYYLAFNANRTSKATAYVEASRIMSLPGADEYYEFCFERTKTLDEFKSGYENMLANPYTLKEAGFDNKQEFMRLTNALLRIYFDGRD